MSTPTARILIVEDQLEIRRLVRMTLEFAGYDAQVHEAADGVTGLEMALALQPQLVLTDWMMPGPVDGLALCLALRSAPATREAKVIMITAKDRATDRAAVLDAGACAYLVKPFSPLKLIQTINALGVVQ